MYIQSFKANWRIFYATNYWRVFFQDNAMSLSRLQDVRETRMTINDSEIITVCEFPMDVAPEDGSVEMRMDGKRFELFSFY